jgi:hypothetical protein
MLPATFGNPPGSGAANEITFISVTSQAQHGGSVLMPSDINSGDIILALTSSEKEGGAQAAAYGTGFTSLQTLVPPQRPIGENSYYARLCTSYKIAAGTEASTSIGGFMNTTHEDSHVFIYRPNFTPTTVTEQDVTTANTTGNPSSTVINGATSVEAIISYGFFVGSGTPSVTWTGATADASPTGTLGYFKHAARTNGFNAGGGVDITADMNDTGNANGYITSYLEIT